jgi:hypothetical protein
MAFQPPLQLAVRKVALRRDLATATVATASGASVPVDLVRQGRRWLLSFSSGGDPSRRWPGRPDASGCSTATSCSPTAS